MKALTIWQPWASLIATGEKIYETRSWPTKYRGPIAIHAAMKDPAKVPITPGLDQYGRNDKSSWIFLPTGCIIATAELVNVWKVRRNPAIVLNKTKDTARYTNLFAVDAENGTCFEPGEKEVALGDWSDGRYAWEIRNVKILAVAPEVKGRQGLWNWDENAPRIPGWKYCGAAQWIKAAIDPFSGERYFLDG